MRGLRGFKKRIFIINSITILIASIFIGYNFSFASWIANSDNGIEIPDVMTGFCA